VIVRRAVAALGMAVLALGGAAPARRASAATGAHVHVGEPSARLASGGRITGRLAGIDGGLGEAR
jgi:hypothetical protein